MSARRECTGKRLSRAIWSFFNKEGMSHFVRVLFQWPRHPSLSPHGHSQPNKLLIPYAIRSKTYQSDTFKHHNGIQNQNQCLEVSRFVCHKSHGSHAIKVCDSPFICRRASDFYAIRPLYGIFWGHVCLTNMGGGVSKNYFLHALPSVSRYFLGEHGLSQKAFFGRRSLS